MSSSVYLVLEGKRTGKVRGDVTTKGRDGQIECVAFDQEVSTARNTGSTAATGVRQYQPVTIRKRIDNTTPLIAAMLVSDEEVTATFRFWKVQPRHTSPMGVEIQFFTVTIHGARVSHQRLYVDDHAATTAAQSATTSITYTPPLEEVSFVFERITWEFTEGGIMAEDEIQ